LPHLFCRFSGVTAHASAASAVRPVTSSACAWIWKSDAHARATHAPARAATRPSARSCSRLPGFLQLLLRIIALVGIQFPKSRERFSRFCFRLLFCWWRRWRRRQWVRGRQGPGRRLREEASRGEEACAAENCDAGRGSKFREDHIRSSPCSRLTAAHIDRCQMFRMELLPRRRMKLYARAEVPRTETFLRVERSWPVFSAKTISWKAGWPRNKPSQAPRGMSFAWRQRESHRQF